MHQNKRKNHPKNNKKKDFKDEIAQSITECEFEYYE